ncbi:hypothetical protein IG7_05573 [Bacillus cereus HuA2-4]|nr:hypothetical protein IG7_05573 [Bacillus cereus HuA2-4]
MVKEMLNKKRRIDYTERKWNPFININECKIDKKELKFLTDRK